MDFTGLKSKEFREAIDKAGRWLVYSAATLGASVIAGIGIAVGAVSWEVGTGAVPSLVAAILAVEKVITKTQGGKDA